MSLLKTNEIQNYNGSSLTLTASTVSTSAQLNTGGNISVTGSLNVSDDSTTRTNLGLGSMATQNANSVAITGGTINTVQPATGQSLTIKDEDGNTAITIGTDNTAAGYLSLNFGSYHGDSGGAGSGTLTGNTLDDYEEGSCSLDIQDSSGNSASALTGNIDGTYVKIGRACLVTYNINNVTTTGLNSTDDVRIYGLPFTAASLTNNQHWTGAVSVGQMTFSGSLVSDLFDASSYFRFREVISGSGGDYLIVSQLTSGSADFFGSFTYYTA